MAANAIRLGKPEVAKLLNKNIRRFLIRYYAEGLVKTLVGDKIKAIVHKVKNTPWRAYRVTMQGKGE